MPNESTKVAGDYNDYIPNTKVIKDFFCFCGEANVINELLWDMFSESISSPDSDTCYRQNAERAFLYKRLTELITALEPPARMRNTDFSEN